MARQTANPKSAPTIATPKHEPAAVATQEQAAPVEPPAMVVAAPDDLRTVVVDLPLSRSTSLYPVTRIELHRPTARTLAHLTDGAMREGWTYRGRPIESVADFLGSLCERVTK